jgi:aldehyde dehydrogenase (NAD+)
MTELSLVYHEIRQALDRLKSWSAPKKVRTGFANFPGRSYILPQPLGQTLIIGAWNYPYQLTLLPLVSALAAGNTAIVKPSEAPARTAQVLKELINANFAPGYLHVIEGGVAVSQELLKHKFDKIFFTGSTAVGKIVAESAAKHLTPVTLELGGKSPCVVMRDAPLERTAQRIVWGKFLNAGQTCIAPDYLLVEKAVYEPLLVEMKKQVLKLLGDNPRNSEAYPRIINETHWKRLMKLIDPSKIYYGGGADPSENYIEPTILKDVTFDDEIMKEEIFGPLLPVISFSNPREVIDKIRSRPRPLALYVFTNEKDWQERFTQDIEFGGGAINDVIMHITNPRLPFGGNGESGMGNYHGEAGFRAFSHYKSILKKPFWLEPAVKYPPHRRWKRLLIRLLMS